MKIKKAVIPVAGLGTRMLPMTKAIPKEMLPIVDKPMIQYIVNECVEAGIEEIVFVTHSSKNSIENHFDSCYELESILEKRVKRQQLEEVREIIPKGVNIMHIRQGIAKGLGHAVLCAKPVVGDHPFAVLLPDVLIDNVKCSLKKDNLAHMLNQFNETQKSQILVEEVEPQLVSNYGIVDINHQDIAPNQSAIIKEIIEKPSVEKAPSNLAVVGRYVFSNHLWDCLKRTPLGVGDEIQLTDAIDLLLEEEEVEAMLIKGLSHDCGSKKGYLKTNFLYTARNHEINLSIEELISFAKANLR